MISNKFARRTIYSLMFAGIAFHPSSGFSANVDMTAEDSREGVTISDKAALSLGVRFVTLFKAPSEEKSLLTLSSDITPMRFSKLISRIQTSDEALKDGGAGFATTFSDSYTNVLSDANLCHGPRIAPGARLEERLRDCANYYPAEYTVAVSYFKTYTTWKAGETESLFDYYMTKIGSDQFQDRIEGRLMVQCLEDQIGDAGNAVGTETAVALSRCTLPKNWKLNKMFEMVDLSTCEDGANVSGLLTFKEDPSNITEYAFDLPTYIRQCVLAHGRVIENDPSQGSRIPSGIDAAVSLIPTIRVEVTKPSGALTYESSHLDQRGSFVIKTYPMSLTSDKLFDALFLRVHRIISSAEFTAGATDGWIPSPFAPDNMKTSDPNWKSYCSVQIPPLFWKKVNVLMQRVSQDTGGVVSGSEAKDQLEFIWKVVAQRIAVIQTLEVLNGSSMISQEAIRLLGIADEDLRNLIQPSVDYTMIAAKSFSDSLDLGYTTSLEDVVAGISELMDNLIQFQESEKAVRSGIENYIYLKAE